MHNSHMKKEHKYEIDMIWTGNTGSGTSGYRAYKRDHEITGTGKPPIPGSSDPVFRGDPSRYNPEELLVAALSACHMLSYLHLCADNGIVVLNYLDKPVGTMKELPNGAGHFTEVVLKPKVTVESRTNLNLCVQLHEKAHELCFIANSMNFPVRCEPDVITTES